MFLAIFPIPSANSRRAPTLFSYPRQSSDESRSSSNELPCAILTSSHTLGELSMHSRRVPNRIVQTPAQCLDLTLAKPLIIIVSLS
ncbi:hypothetical protein GW17_00059593 [Ensete ventricosum]|nr:hypothetical protein GW17_00059593 [Ensete ventricosum]